MLLIGAILQAQLTAALLCSVAEFAPETDDDDEEDGGVPGPWTDGFYCWHGARVHQTKQHVEMWGIIFTHLLESEARSDLEQAAGPSYLWDAVAHCATQLMMNYPEPYGGGGDKEFLIPIVLEALFKLMGKFPNGFKSRVHKDGEYERLGFFMLRALCSLGDYSWLKVWTEQTNAAPVYGDKEAWVAAQGESLREIYADCTRNAAQEPANDYLWELMVHNSDVGTHYESEAFARIFINYIQRIWEWSDEQRTSQGLPLGPAENYRRHDDPADVSRWGGGKIHHW